VAGATTRCVPLNGQGSLKYVGRCRHFVPKDCTPTAAGEICSAAAEFRDGKCQEKLVPTGTVLPRKDGETCGSNDADGKARNCGHNLVCNSKRVCQKKSMLGEACGSAYQDCVNGAVCEQRKCVAKYSVRFGDNCESDLACGTGFCDPQTNRCSFNLLSNKCLRDYECAAHAAYSVCLGSDGVSTQGTCTKNYYPQGNLIGKCVAEKCSAPYGDAAYDELCPLKLCNVEFATYQCATYCGKSEDERVLADYEYNFDCKEFKATAWADTGSCKITQQFSGCDEDIFGRMAQVSAGSLETRVTLAAMIVALVAFVVVL